MSYLSLLSYFYRTVEHWCPSAGGRARPGELLDIIGLQNHPFCEEDVFHIQVIVTLFYHRREVAFELPVAGRQTTRWGLNVDLDIWRAAAFEASTTVRCLWSHQRRPQEMTKTRSLHDVTIWRQQDDSFSVRRFNRKKKAARDEARGANKIEIQRRYPIIKKVISHSPTSDLFDNIHKYAKYVNFFFRLLKIKNPLFLLHIRMRMRDKTISVRH